MPHFVFLGFGAMDSHLREFSDKKFMDSYIGLIKMIQELPTKPMVFLMVPMFNCLHKLPLSGSTEMVSDFLFDTSECKPDQSRDMTPLIKQIAANTSIPSDHIVNAWQITRNVNNKESAIYSDNVHPNEKGLAMIAQEFYEKMSFS